MKNRMLRAPEVVEATGLCRATIYKLISQGEFPRPVKLTGRAVAWREADLEDWLASREVAPRQVA